MVELLRYLEAHGFTSTSPRAATATSCAPSPSELYGIPPERVIGSSLRPRLRARTARGGSSSTWREPDFFDDGPVKPVRIWSRIGRRPLIAVGNSNGDIPVLRFAGGDGARAAAARAHDDAEREFDYTAGAEQRARAAAAAGGWTVVSIKDDWATVFA